MDADVLAEIKSRPFLRLHLEPRGPAVIAKILTYALQPVDVFVTKLPRDAQRCRFIRRVGPTPVWLTIRGFKQRSKIDEKTGVSECLVETNDAGQQAPSWYVARIETKLGVVCKSWKNIMDGNDAGNPMVNLMAAYSSTFRISAETLLSEPDTYRYMFSHPQETMWRYNQLQIVFDTPTNSPGFTNDLGHRARMPFSIKTIDFRFFPCSDHPTYVFEPRAFFRADSFVESRNIIFTLPYLSSNTQLSSSFVVLRRQDEKKTIFNYIPDGLHVFIDSWNASDYSMLPLVLADLVAVFGRSVSSTIPPSSYEVRTMQRPHDPLSTLHYLCISLPRSQQASTLLLRAWKYSHHLKLPHATILTTKLLGIFNTSTELTSLLFFLGNLLPSRVQQLVISPIITRPSFHPTRSRPVNGYQHLLWASENSATDVDFSILEASTWQRSSTGTRLRGVGHAIPTIKDSNTQFRRTLIANPLTEPKFLAEVLRYVDHRLQKAPVGYHLVPFVTSNPAVLRIGDETFNKMYYSGIKVAKRNGTLDYDSIRRAIASVVDIPPEPEVTSTSSKTTTNTSTQVVPQRRSGVGASPEKGSSGNANKNHEDFDEEAETKRVLVKLETGIDMGSPRINAPAEQTLAPAPQSQEPRENSRVLLAPTGLTNAYPGERQAWDCLTRVVFAIDGAENVRKKEDEDMRALVASNIAGKSKVEPFLDRPWRVRQGMGGLNAL